MYQNLLVVIIKTPTSISTSLPQAISSSLLNSTNQSVAYRLCALCSAEKVCAVLGGSK